MLGRATTTTNLSRQRIHSRDEEGSEVGEKVEVVKSCDQEKAKEKEEMSVTKVQEEKVEDQGKMKRLFFSK